MSQYERTLGDDLYEVGPQTRLLIWEVRQRQGRWKVGMRCGIYCRMSEHI